MSKANKIFDSDLFMQYRINAGLTFTSTCLNHTSVRAQHQWFSEQQPLVWVESFMHLKLFTLHVEIRLLFWIKQNVNCDSKDQERKIYNFVLYKIIEKQNSYMNFSEMYSFWNYIYLKFTLLRFSNIFQFWWISFCSLVIPVILIFMLMSH